MVSALSEDHGGAELGRQDIVVEVGQVNSVPNHPCCGRSLLISEGGVGAKEGVLAIKGCVAQSKESLDIPLLNMALISVHVDGEVKEV